MDSAYPDYLTYAGELRKVLFEAQLQKPGTQLVVDPENIPVERRDGARGYGLAAWKELGRIYARGLAAPLILAVLAATYLFSQRRGDPADSSSSLQDRASLRFALLAGALPLVVWTFYPWKVERAFVTAVPGLCLLAGLGYARAAKQFPRLRFLFTLTVVIASGLSAYYYARYERSGPSPFAQTVDCYADWLATQPAGTITARSVHWRGAPLWKWYLGAERANRGVAFKCVDFSSRELPLAIIRDHDSDLPDSLFAGNAPEFVAASPVADALLRDTERGVGVILVRSVSPSP